MKIAVLHISDIHYCCDERFENQELICKKVAATLYTIHFEALIVVVSGDITFCGSESDFVAAGQLVNSIKKEILKSAPNKEIKVICVPGNHDIHHEPSRILKNIDLEKLKHTQTYSKMLSKEHKKLKCYYDFAKQEEWITEKEVLHRFYITLDTGTETTKIEVNQINTALFSIIDGEYKGLLYYHPQEAVKQYCTPASSAVDYVFTVMHHSPAWFIDDVSSEIEHLISTRSSILFTGHEHNQFSIGQTVAPQDNPMLKLTGGAFSNKQSWENSEFNLLVLDTRNNSVSQQVFKWNPSESIYYSVNDTRKQALKRYVNFGGFELSKEFQQTIELDEKNPDMGNIQDYYVFPRLVQEAYSTDKEINSFEDFDLFCNDKQIVFITGKSNDGKTKLLCFLFMQYYLQNDKSKRVLFLSAEDLYQRKSVEKVIRAKISEEYKGKYVTDYFFQTPISNRLVFIDDFDLIDSDKQSEILQYCKAEFGYVICTLGEKVHIDINQYLDDAFSSDHIARLSFARLFSDKRKELVGKIVERSTIGAERRKKVCSDIVESIDKKKALYFFEPDFLIKYTNYCCNHLSEFSSNDGNVFSTVFESTITLQLEKHRKGNLPTDKIKLLISKFAYSLHLLKKDLFTFDELHKVVQQYNDDYGSNVHSTELWETMEKARIIKPMPTDSYGFVYEHYFAYFIAKEINHEEEDVAKVDLENLIKYSCYRINSDILLYLIYLSEKPTLIHLMLTRLEEYSKDWEELSIKENLPEYLKHNYAYADIEIPKEKTDKEKTLEEVEHEKHMVKNENKEPLLYAYDEQQTLSEINQIIRMLALYLSVSRSLPAFEHFFKSDLKKRIISMIYQLPNKVFLYVAKQCNDDELQRIKGAIDKRFDSYEGNKTKEELFAEIQNAIYRNSVVLLLNLYYLGISFATKDNTYQYLKSFDSTQNLCYQIQRLLIEEKQGNANVFVNEVIAMKSEVSKYGFAHSLVKDIVYHASQYKKGISGPDKQKMAAFLAPNNKNKQKELLIGSLKKANKE